MGFTAAPTLIAAQSASAGRSAAWSPGTNMFFRSAGSAVGVAVFGAIANATLGGPGVEGGRVPPAALTTAVHHVFLAPSCWPLAMLAAVLLMPRDRGRAGQPTTAGDGRDTPS